MLIFFDAGVALMKKILIADDEIAIRLLIHSTLENEEYNIIESQNGLETVEKYRDEAPDLLILDLMMPGLSGSEVCEKIRADPNAKKAPIIILTAKGKISDEAARQEFGADFYLTKPFSPLELLACVNQVLNKTNPR
jgi:DNA-binding response OmpR family regulator